VRTATAGCNVSKSVTTVGKLRSIADERQGADHSAQLLVDPLGLNHASLPQQTAHHQHASAELHRS
jgi:hypothetical protein